MRVLLVRHAVAEDREHFARTGRDDTERPLTALGRRRVRRAAAGLMRVLPKVDTIATSPLTRAVETAVVLAGTYGIANVRELTQLSPGRPSGELLNWLKKQSDDGAIVVVGHEPDLGRTASWLLCGIHESFLPLKKGGACLIEFDGAVEAGAAMLAWVLRPRELRRLGNRA